MAVVLKTTVGETPPGVRIPLPPPTFAHACHRARELRLASHAKVSLPDEPVSQQARAIFCRADSPADSVRRSCLSEGGSCVSEGGSRAAAKADCRSL